MRSRSLLLYALCCGLFGFIGHAAQAQEYSATPAKVESLPQPQEEYKHPSRKRSETSGAVSTDLYKELGIHSTCKNAKKPSCANGMEPEKINTGFCFRYVCKDGKTDTCPSRAQPICKDGTKLVAGVDSKGCPTATCQKTDVSCMQIICKEGTTPVNTGKTNSVGCPIMRCEDKSCPVYNKPLCEGGEVVMVKDKFGCERPTCGKKDECPAYNKPLCEGGDVVMTKDKNGCDRPTCVKKDVSTSCAQVLCREGTTRVATGTNSAGCTTYTCKETTTSVSCAQVICKEGTSRVYVGKNNVGCPVYKCAPASASSLVR